MENIGEFEQFQLLEQKIDSLLELVSTLKKEKAALAEQTHIQEEKLVDLSEQLSALKAGRDKARQRIVSLLERMEQAEV
ncbi:MAG: cell division protein ZapB [Desulfatiglandaceae bacterium]